MGILSWTNPEKKVAGSLEASPLVLRAWNLFQSITHAPESNYSGAVFLITPSELGDRSIWIRGASIFWKLPWLKSSRTGLQTDLATLVACFGVKNTFSDRSLSSGNVFTQVQKYCDVHTHDFATETSETHTIPTCTNTIVLGRGIPLPRGENERESPQNMQLK